MAVQENSITNAVAKLLNPQVEQVEAAELEPESPQEETLEATDQEDQGDDLEDNDVVFEEEEDVAESDQDDDQEEYEEEPDDNETYYKVKVDGEESEVNLQELLKGYQTEKSNTKKSQKLSDELKELATLKGTLQEERNKYIQVTEQLAKEQYSVLEAARVELTSIDKTEDPIGYVQKQLEIQDIEKALAQKSNDYDLAQSQMQKDSQETDSTFLAEQSKILSDAMPEWDDPEKSEAVRAGITNFARSQGYTDEDLNNVKSARDIIVLNKAKKYDEMIAARAKVRGKRSPQEASPKVRSSTRKSNDTNKARTIKASKNTFQRSGSVKDAASLMLQMSQTRKTKK